MNKYIVLCTLAGTLLSCGEDSLRSALLDEVTQNESSNNGTMSTFSGRPIVFYNVENLFDTKNDPRTNDEDFTPHGYKQWDEERYETKLERITDALSEFQKPPLMIGLAEIENRAVLKDLIKEGDFKKTNYGIAHFDSPDRRGIDVALLYDQDAFTLINSSKLRVRLANNPRFATRDILYVEGELAGGVKTHVFVNHWSSRREGKLETEHKRVEAAETLREKVDEILAQDVNANIIILGDFNDHPTDKSLQTVLRAKESGYEGDGDLINLLFDEHTNGEGTSVYRGDWAVLDQIIISQAIYDEKSGIGIKGKDAEILMDDDLIFTNRGTGERKPNATYGGRKYYGGYSDHLPVYIILK
ncbi:MAG: endonuclease [Crocinitomicaceae bacterium]|nr:endonuclease [Flavobacteriales bacterium]NQZ36658.1 endonuclease [Crocinitomicaceae bacterium]PHR33592.1 MAG: endonuclease [Fluviicola sp.]